MAKKTNDSSTVTRISAKDTTSKKTMKPSSKAAKKSQKKTTPETNVSTKNPVLLFIRYVKGAWYELKQVRWPTRSATWSLTLAVLLFSGFFVLLILLLDAGFKYIFEQLLK